MYDVKRLDLSFTSLFLTYWTLTNRDSVKERKQ